jgi:hypothetical protein
MMLGGPGQEMRDDLEPVADALTRSNPAATLKWLEGPAARRLLAAVAASLGPVTHDTLDQLLPSKAVAHLRAALVTAAVLPERDEQLAAFERWLDQALTCVTGDDDRRTIRSYAT